MDNLMCIPPSPMERFPGYGNDSVQTGHLVIWSVQTPFSSLRTKVRLMPRRLTISNFESFSLRQSRLISAVFLATDLALPKAVPLAQPGRCRL